MAWLWVDNDWRSKWGGVDLNTNYIVFMWLLLWWELGLQLAKFRQDHLWTIPVISSSADCFYFYLSSSFWRVTALLHPCSFQATLPRLWSESVSSKLLILTHSRSHTHLKWQVDLYRMSKETLKKSCLHTPGLSLYDRGMIADATHGKWQKIM